jgi:hypothetical protein
MADDRKLHARYETELYITKGGQIGIRQETPYEEEASVVVFDAVDVPKIVKWLQDLAAERQATPDEQFAQDADEDSARQ